MTAAQVQRTIETAEIYRTEPPRPLRRELPPSEPYPIEALGSLLSAAARGIHDRVQAPVAICAQSVLAAASLAVQAHVDVVLPMGHAKPASMFLVTVAESGERKNACDTEALWPIRKREQSLREQYDGAIEGYRNDKDAWQKQRERLLSDHRKYPDRAAKCAALEQLGPAPNPPLDPMLLCTEPTFEGLAKLLMAGQPSVGVFSAEGGQFVGGHAMNPDNKLRTAAGLSGLWDGDAIRRVRAGDGAILLPGRRIAMHLMVQPDVAALILSDRQLADQGLLSRLLVSAPEPACGTRFWREAEPQSEAAIKRYGARLLTLLERQMPLAEGRPNELAPRKIGFAPKAREAWIAFFDHVERELKPNGGLEPVRALGNKLPEHAARLATVLQILSDFDAGEITAQHMAAGITLAQYYASEALRLFGARATSSDILHAERLLKWLSESWAEPAVSLPDIYQLGPNAIRDMATARKAVGLLEEHGHLVRIESGAVVRGARRREAWRLICVGQI